ncbi:MAG: hypothetical protein C4542_08180 [Dehalococcoidia bacterium]|nr:MAG: hypothetical protein C4542_08180 [Dehalococcoidia bacterium]
MFGIDDLIAAGVGTVTSAIGGIGAYKAQKKGINQALETQRESKAALEPWQQAGEDALKEWSSKVMAGPGEFKESEGYKWTLGEGEKAIKRGASTSAGFGTGAMGKSLIRYGQGLASNEYDKFQDRYLKSLVPYQQLTGVGQWAVGNKISINDQIADLEVDKGMAKANAWVTGANAVRGGISDAVSLSQLGGNQVPMGTSTPPISPSIGSFSGGYNANNLSMSSTNPYRQPLVPGRL